MGIARVRLELGFGVIRVNAPVLLEAASPDRTGDLSHAVGAVKSLTQTTVLYNILSMCWVLIHNI